MGKRYNQSSDSKHQQFDDDFEDFGYEVKNIRRQSKKKVAKFKREQDHYEDSYWTDHYLLTGHQDRVLYGSRQEFTWQFKSSSTHTTRLRSTLLMHPSTPSFIFVSVASVPLLRVWTASTIASWMRLLMHGVHSLSRSVATPSPVCQMT